MAVLSVDLTYRRWSDLGIVVLDRARAAQPPNLFQIGADLSLKQRITRLQEPEPTDSTIACEIIPWSDPGFGADSGVEARFNSAAHGSSSINAEVLAGRLNHLCNVRGIQIMMLDGPQAWKSRYNGLKHARVSERQLNTAAKTGLPGMVKPLSYRPFSEFCLDVYEALCHRGWRRLDTCEQPGPSSDRILVESYPYAAWKSLGIKPLPAKRRSKVSDISEAFAALRALIPLTVNRPPNHDQLQATVGGLPGLALEAHSAVGVRIVGTPPRREEGHWREGFIVLPLPPFRSTGLRWLH